MMKRRSFRGRRGQQAMEYMVTYGWAFVVIIVTIGAFAYFGLLNPEKYLPSRCDFGMQLKCVDYRLQENANTPGEILLQFQNAFGEDIRIYDLQLAGDAGGRFEDSSFTPYAAGYLLIADGDVNSIDEIMLNLNINQDVPPDHYLVKKDKALVPIVVTFSRDENNAPLHTVVGEVFASVQ